MEYLFNNLSPESFQRLLNAVLLPRFGESLRITPLRGADGGRDAETPPATPGYEFDYRNTDPVTNLISAPPRKGRYLFQAKHHRTTNSRPTDLRRQVLREFEEEIKKNVLRRKGNDRVNYFFLVTNVPSSKEAIENLDEKREKLTSKVRGLNTEIWWQEQLTAFLDQAPSIWAAFPELFPGRQIPILGLIGSDSAQSLPRTLRVAIARQFKRDSVLRFRQLGLEQPLSRLFVPLDTNIADLSEEKTGQLFDEFLKRDAEQSVLQDRPLDFPERDHLASQTKFGESRLDAVNFLLAEWQCIDKFYLIEGGPGQGKSTLTQVLAQIHRQAFLRQSASYDQTWPAPPRARLPIRVELRRFADWLAKQDHGAASVEQFIAGQFSEDAANAQFLVEDVHKLLEVERTLLIFDGLDEVGSDEQRAHILDIIENLVTATATVLDADTVVIVTTRPPAMVGHRDRLANFTRLPLAPLSEESATQYVDKWTNVHLVEEDERKRVIQSFETRSQEHHVRALAQNPMQLSVLLHFIRLKGEAFPAKRAELYREYFRTVIDRDVEKSPELAARRELIEHLHEFIGYKIHALTEATAADGSLARLELLKLVGQWLSDQGNSDESPAEIFRLGEERLGLLTALRGEGEETRYGFEIQPVREYFAAAYFNEQVRGDAHDIFEALIVRPFWREVALSLGGLRRSNEKADLVARARKVDRAAEPPWACEGKFLIFQLLREGVFDHPAHIFCEAVDYVIDSFSEFSMRIGSRGFSFAEELSELLIAGNYEPKTQIRRQLDEINEESEPLCIFQLFEMARRILPTEEVKRRLLELRTRNAKLHVISRIFWPERFGIDVSDMSNEESFWSQAPPNAWAAALWGSSREGSETWSVASVPDNVRLCLIEELALSDASPFNLLRFHRRDSVSFRKEIDSSAFQLQAFIDCLWMSAATRVRGQISRKEYERAAEELISEPPKEVFEELPGELHNTIETLTKLCHETVRADLSEEDLPKLLESRSAVFLSCLNVEGISWCVVLRALEGVILATAFSPGILPDSRSKSVAKRVQYLYENYPTVRPLLDVIAESRALGTNDGASRIKDICKLFRDLFRPYGKKIWALRKVRLPGHTTLVPISDLIKDYLCEKRELPFSWLERSGLWEASLRELLRDSQVPNDRILAEFANRAEWWLPRTFECNKTEMRQLIKLIESSSDSAAIRGAASLLASTNVWTSLPKEQLLRVLRADTRISFLASRIFGGSFRHRRRVVVGRSENLGELIDAAWVVVNEREDWPTWVYAEAIEFLLEMVPRSKIPLGELEQQLGLS